MKKLFFVLACAGMLAISASAQQKDAKALTDEAQKAYNAYFLKAQMGKMDDEAAASLIKSFQLYNEALANDTVYEKEKDGSPKIDKKTGKPKFKAKNSESIVKALQTMAAQRDFLIVGEYYREPKKDYHNAALCYGTDVALQRSKYAQNVPDSTIAEALFLQGFALYFDNDFVDCFDCMSQAKALGYTANNIDAFISDASNRMINAFVEKKDYAGANATLDKLIAKNPKNSELEMLKARVMEFDKGFKDAEPYYLKSLELDPRNAFTLYCLGVGYCGAVNEAMMASKATTDAGVAKDIAPYLDKPIDYLTRALDAGQGDKLAKEYIDDINTKLELLNKYKALVK